jgi:hypothetical protein
VTAVSDMITSAVNPISFSSCHFKPY